jgi:DnaJ-class molecular chaperone
MIQSSILLKDYYSILGCEKDATEEDIYNKYKNQIKRFNNLPFHTKQMIIEIKELKEAIYILGNKSKRTKYDKKIKLQQSYTDIKNDQENELDNTKICDRLFSITFD